MDTSTIGRLCNIKTGEVYLDHDETAGRLGVASGTLYNWRYRDHPHIPHVKISGRAYYLERDVNAWVQLNTSARAA